LCSDGVWRVLQERHVRRLADIRKLEHGVVDLLTQVERRSRKDCDNISAILFRWEDEPSTVDPVYGLTVPNIDQKALWSKTTTGASTAGQKSRKRKGKRTKQIERGEIQSTIEELESFVTDLDGLLEDS
jgi:serine/threonine protein phosphatase PrpC